MAACKRSTRSPRATLNPRRYRTAVRNTCGDRQQSDPSRLDGTAVTHAPACSGASGGLSLSLLFLSLSLSFSLSLSLSGQSLLLKTHSHKRQSNRNNPPADATYIHAWKKTSEMLFSTVCDLFLNSVGIEANRQQLIVGATVSH